MSRHPAAYLLSFLTVVATASSVQAQTPAACAPVTKEQIAALGDKWQTNVTTGDAEAIAALYADDAVLLPMMSAEQRIGRDAIRGYFQQYAKRHPSGGLKERTITIGCNTATDVSTYLFRLTGQRKGTREAVNGRYSTTYQFRDGRWWITLQHASMMNVGAKAAVPKPK